MELSKRYSFDDLNVGQLKAVLRLGTEDSTLLIGGMGAGKTVVALAAAKVRLESNRVRRVLVIATQKICRTVWQQEAEKWADLEGIEIAIACGTPHQRSRAISSDAQIVLINYECINWLIDIYPTLYNFDGLIIDEISKLKSSSGSTFKKLRHKMRLFRWRVGMTGTPVAESLDALYAYDLLLTSGATLGKNKEHFHNEYFFNVGYQYDDFVAMPDAFERLAEKLSPLIHTMPEYTHTLPELTVIDVPVELPLDARKQYKKLAKDMLLELGDTTIVAPNRAVLSNKLQQAAQGFLYDDDSLAALHFHYAKIEAAVRVLLASKGPVIVVYWYAEDKAALLDQLDCATLDDDIEQTVTDWKAGKLARLLVHPRSCGHGLDLAKGGHEMLFLGPVWSRDLWLQTIARLWRQGQKERVTVWVLMATHTIDKIIRDRCDEKGDVQKEFMRHLESTASQSL